MKTIEQWMKLIDHKITECSPCGWGFWGENVYTFSHWNGDHEGYSTDITFDTSTSVVYEITLCNYGANTAQRWINSEYGTDHPQLKLEAWDGVHWADIATEGDLLKLVADTVGGIVPSYTEIEVDLDRDVICDLALMAHSKNITLNQLINQILQEEMDRENT